MAVDTRWLVGVAAALLMLSVGCNGSTRTSVTQPSAVSSTTTTGPVATDNLASTEEPVATLAAFLQAEIDGAFDRSFQYLTASDQKASGGVSGWAAEHLFVLPTIVGYSISRNLTDTSRSEVTVDLVLRPSLDQMVGLTTSSANSTWVMEKEDSGWKVALTQSIIEPVYLDDQSAPDAVKLWVEQRVACDVSVQWDQALLGYPTLADPLCGADEVIAIGEPGRLSDAAESAPFLAAFGPEVGLWSRVVAVDRPVPLRVVVAPIGEQWLVIGVLEASPS